MKDKLKQLLKKLGLTTEQINDVIADEPKYTPNDLADTIQQSLKEVLENDEDFTRTIHSKVRGEVLTSKEKKIMKLWGITKEEYDALPKETKFDSLLELAAKKKAEADGGGKNDDEKDKEIARLNGEIVTYKDKVRKLEEEDIPGIRNSVEADKKMGRIERKLMRMYNGSDPKRKLVVDGELGVEMIMRKLQDRFDLDIDPGTDKVTLYKKGTKLKATEDNKMLDFEAMADQVASSGKLLVVSNGKPTVKKKGADTSDDDDDGDSKPKVSLPGLDKAKQHAKEMRKRAAAGADDDDDDDADDDGDDA